MTQPLHLEDQLRHLHGSVVWHETPPRMTAQQKGSIFPRCYNAPMVESGDRLLPLRTGVLARP